MSGARRSIATTEGLNRGRTVAVAGGGIAGLAVALALAQRGARVTVFEQAASLREYGAGLQITPNGGAVLAALGLGSEVETAGIAAQALEPMDGMTGARVARFALNKLPGAGYRFFHRPDILAMLAHAARDEGVEIRTGARVVAGDGRLRTGSGEAVDADLTIGADGLHSALRPMLNGAAEPFFTGQVAWRAIVEMEARPVARLWLMPGQHVVTYPLHGGRLNIVAVREQAGWAEEGWHVADDPANLRAAFGGACAELRAVLERVSEVRLWGLFRHPVAACWHGGDVAILGDAAHPTLPFLAQGANLALEDAWVLAAAVDRWPLPEALARYQAARRPRVARAISAANGNAVTYHLSGLRRAAALGALGAVGRVAPGLFLRRYDWLYRHDVTQADI
jgi:salicylate hydroxylase